MKKIINIFLLCTIFSCNKENKNETKLINNNTSFDAISNKKNNSEQVSNQKLETLENKILTNYLEFNDNSETSNQFAETFYSLIKNNQASLTFDFDELKKQTSIRIVTSANKKLRVYSWDNMNGGTMRFFNQIFQFENNNKVFTTLNIANEDPLASIFQIFTIEKTNNEPIYLVVSNSVLSTSLSTQSIDAYSIENNKLTKTKIFKTKKEELSSINFEYDFFSVVDRPERPVELITFENNILKIPLIEENGNVTTKNLIYKWNGTIFNYEGIK